ncbi:hypothetical protein L2E82_46137 [Cichorium intybus]|uniref:Uncharacterized protein n=1 Tax=Cichorium intybus TaxID=13427 RepID=A0ACB8YSX9_CICIN|nr:hypothetical protein L2E82_46137 [Cichorium intybus]
METRTTLFPKSTQSSPKVVRRETLGMAIIVLGSSLLAKFFIPKHDKELVVVKYIWVAIIDIVIFLSISMIYGDTWLMILKPKKEASRRLNYIQRSFVAVARNCMLLVAGLTSLHGAD